MPMEREALQVSLNEAACFSHWVEGEKPEDVAVVGIFYASQADVAELMQKPLGSDGLKGVTFPVACDREKKTVDFFGAMSDNGLARCLAILGGQRQIQYHAVYPSMAFRSVGEVKRLLLLMRKSDRIKESFYRRQTSKRDKSDSKVDDKGRTKVESKVSKVEETKVEENEERGQAKPIIDKGDVAVEEYMEELKIQEGLETRDDGEEGEWNGEACPWQGKEVVDGKFREWREGSEDDYSYYYYNQGGDQEEGEAGVEKEHKAKVLTLPEGEVKEGLSKSKGGKKNKVQRRSEGGREEAKGSRVEYSRMIAKISRAPSGKMSVKASKVESLAGHDHFRGGVAGEGSSNDRRDKRQSLQGRIEMDLAERKRGGETETKSRATSDEVSEIGDYYRQTPCNSAVAQVRQGTAMKDTLRTTQHATSSGTVRTLDSGQTDWIRKSSVIEFVTNSTDAQPGLSFSKDQELADNESLKKGNS